jgi:autotransporter-associated beta strand protein
VGNVTLGSATLTTGNDNTSTTFSGVISGTGGLVKIGAGTLTLTGANTYTGPTIVSGGMLQVGNGGTVGNIGGNGSFGIDRSGRWPLAPTPTWAVLPVGSPSGAGRYSFSQVSPRTVARRSMLVAVRSILMATARHHR